MGEELGALEALGYAGYDPEPTTALEGLAALSRASPDQGLLLLTDEHDAVILIDRKGQVCWSLNVPQRSAVELAEPLPDGRLATLSVDQGIDLFGAKQQHLGSWDLACHHDMAHTSQDKLLVLAHRESPYHGRRVRFDSIIELDLGDPSRAPRTVWDSLAALDPLLALAGSSPLDLPPSTRGANPSAPGASASQKTYDRFHLNSIMVLPPSVLGAEDSRFAAGNLLLCFRNASLLAILEPQSGELVWSFGPLDLDFPHHPSLLANGRILAFDNGWHRGWSRLVEIDPGKPKGAQPRIAWTWQASTTEAFFSKTRGAVERLSAGHSLITDSERGRLFELDRKGRLVWQWSRPLEADGRRRRIYRATRVGDNWATKVLGKQLKSK